MMNTSNECCIYLPPGEVLGVKTSSLYVFKNTRSCQVQRELKKEKTIRRPLKACQRWVGQAAGSLCSQHAETCKTDPSAARSVRNQTGVRPVEQQY